MFYRYTHKWVLIIAHKTCKRANIQNGPPPKNSCKYMHHIILTPLLYKFQWSSAPVKKLTILYKWMQF
jgi:hypothetical protein